MHVPVQIFFKLFELGDSFVYSATDRMVSGHSVKHVLARLIADEPRHGYDLIRAIEDMTGGEYAPSPGIVYPTLTMLQDMGLIEEAKDKSARKPFQITSAGRDHLDERSDEADDLIDRLKALAPDERSETGPAIGRAIKNLMTALSHRIGRDGLDEELLRRQPGEGRWSIIQDLPLGARQHAVPDDQTPDSPAPMGRKHAAHEPDPSRRPTRARPAQPLCPVHAGADALDGQRRLWPRQ